MPHASARLLAWRPLRKSSLVGFARVQFGSGLIINEIAVHVAGSRAWAQPPARPWLEGNALVLTEEGKPRWQPVVDFANHGVRASWSRQVVNVVREAHPDLFPEDVRPD
jgi:hypothetical protein